MLHTYLAMLAIIPLVFIAFTGFILTHDEWFEADDDQAITTVTVIPSRVLAARDRLALVEHLRTKESVVGAIKPFDWPDAHDGADEPLRLTFESPRCRTEVEVSLPDGETSIVTEVAPLAALLTNLHKGKQAGRAWRFLLDATAVLLGSASISGDFLWRSLPRRRKWGLIALAVTAVAILIVYFVAVP